MIASYATPQWLSLLGTIDIREWVEVLEEYLTELLPARGP